MQEEKPSPGLRVATSDDLEVSTYLEIAKQKEGVQPEPVAAPPSVREGVAIIDFGSQYSRLIARRVRELKVYCEILPHDAPWLEKGNLALKGVILSGGPASRSPPAAGNRPAKAGLQGGHGGLVWCRAGRPGVCPAPGPEQG